MTTRRTPKAPAKAGADDDPDRWRVVEVDPAPRPAGFLFSGDPDYVAEREALFKEWAAKMRGAEALGGAVYAAVQWREAGVDPGEVIDEIAANPDSALARLALAMTKRPEVRERKPRQGKSAWSPRMQAELVVAVQRRMLEPTLVGVGGPKRTIRHVCAKLSSREGPEQWRGKKGLERRYREAASSDAGAVMLWMIGMILERVRPADRGDFLALVDKVAAGLPNK